MLLQTSPEYFQTEELDGMFLDMPDFIEEEKCFASGARVVAGVDEVGRGPLAGPETAAAVILDPSHVPAGLDDSKQLKLDLEEQRRVADEPQDRQEPVPLEKLNAGRAAGDLGAETRSDTHLLLLPLRMSSRARPLRAQV